MENASQYVAANVRRLRRGREWSLAQLSAALEERRHALSVPVLSKMELGDRGIDVDDLVALAGVFDVPVTVLLADPEVATQERLVLLVDEWLVACNEQTEALKRHAERERAAFRLIRDAISDDSAAKAAIESVLRERMGADTHWPQSLTDAFVEVGDHGDR